MKLSNEREVIFNERFNSVKAFVCARFKHARDIDDIVQEATIAYATALATCDLNDNYHSYCMTAAKWAAVKCVKRQNDQLCGNEQSDYHFENNEDLLSNGICDESDVNSCSINPVLLCSVLEKVQTALAKLKPAHKAFIESSYWHAPKHKNTIKHIKERRGRDIKKAFYASVKQGIEDDVIFCESGISTIDYPRIH